MFDSMKRVEDSVKGTSSNCNRVKNRGRAAPRGLHGSKAWPHRNGHNYDRSERQGTERDAAPRDKSKKSSAGQLCTVSSESRSPRFYKVINEWGS